MRSKSLFRRTFIMFMLGGLLTILVFTSVFITSRQQESQESFEKEIQMQAQEVAEYMAHMDQISLVRRNSTLQYILRQKLTDIYTKYNADIWIVSYNAGYVEYIDKSWNTSENIASEPVLEQLAVIQSGREIRVTNLFPELGDQIVTIGVPWRYSDGTVVGAILLHIPTANMKVSILDTLEQIFPSVIFSILISTLLAYFLTRSLTKPLEEINHAVLDFSKGDLTRRVNLNCGGELETLGNNINNMAVELSNLEDSRRTFVANVSHELRSPMTCMRGYVQAMLDGTIAKEDMPHYLQIVMDETIRLTDLVKDLLDLSRLESGKFPLNPAPFNANELLCRNLVTFETRISEKNIDVEVDMPDDPLYATGDVNRLNQVVSNIIDNAIKYMQVDNGKLILTVAQEGKNVRFLFENNGQPIPAEDLPHIFERFYKADKAHTSGMGTGLGLSICQRIMQQHGSMITVTSEPGKTVFSFVLPSAEAPKHAEPAQ